MQTLSSPAPSDDDMTMPRIGVVTIAPPPAKEEAITTKSASPQRRQRQWLRHVPFALIFMLAIYLITINVTTPWQSFHEDNGTLNESIAINHLRYGLGVTKGQDLLDIEAKQSSGPLNVSEAAHFNYFLTGPVHPEVYGDHPPLLGLTIAGAFLIFGPHFWSERLVPILYALAGLLLFYLLVCHFFDITTARFAAFLYATFPMMAYYGRNISHEAPTLFWALLLLTAYLRWRENEQSRWRWVMPIAIVIGGFYGWPLFYFAFILFAIDWLARRKFDRSLALVTIVPAVITFMLVIAQIAWALGGDIHHTLHMLLIRLSGGDEKHASDNTISWLNQITTWNAEVFGLWTQLALPFVAFFLLKRFSVERWSPRIVMVVLLAAWGISHMLIFRNGAYVHDYWQFYLLPFYAVAPAWALVSFVRQQLASPRARGIALAVAGGVVMNLALGTIVYLYSYQGAFLVKPLFDLWH